MSLRGSFFLDLYNCILSCSLIWEIIYFQFSEWVWKSFLLDVYTSKLWAKQHLISWRISEILPFQQEDWYSMAKNAASYGCPISVVWTPLLFKVTNGDDTRKTQTPNPHRWKKKKRREWTWMSLDPVSSFHHMRKCNFTMWRRQLISI